MVFAPKRTIRGVGSYAVGYTHNLLDRLSSTIYPDGEVVETTYNQQGLPESLVGADTYVTGVDYTIMGQLDTLSLGNTLSTVYSYNPFTFRLNRIKTENLLDLSYSYDPVGNVTMIQDDTKDEGQGFTYDSLDRLTGVLEEEAIGEIGYINDTLTQTVRTIPFQRTYQNPVVFAQPLSRDGGDKSVVRITQVGADSFSLYLDEAPNYDGAHGTEAVSYLVIEAGAWELSDGTRLEAGKVNTSATVGLRRAGSWQNVTYANSFPAAPAVFSQVQTNGDASFVKTRQRNVTTTGFQMAMEEEENSTTSHGSETLGWLAIQVGGGRWSGKKYAAGQTSNAVTNSWYTLNFGADLGAGLRFLASIGTYNNSDYCELRYNRLTASSTGVSVMVEEDTTYDAETTHPAEVVYYLAFGGDGLLGGHAAGAGPASPDYAWTYDEIPKGTMVGNMTSRSEGASTVAYSYNDANHVHAVTGLTGGLSFAYDVNGNMTSRDHEDTTYLQKFDVENRLVAITDTQTLSVTQFFYDGDGNRVKTVYPDGSWTAFIGEHYEVDDDYSTRSYYFLGSQRVAMRIQKDGQADQLYFFHTDHLGSTSLLSNEVGQYVDGTEARYLPYGGYRVEPTADLTDYGFTGHKQQDEVELIFMRARFYSPSLGRFLSADTIVPEPGNPQSFNRYSYGENNPIKFIDKNGHDSGLPITSEWVNPFDPLNPFNQALEAGGVCLTVAATEATPYIFLGATGMALGGGGFIMIMYAMPDVGPGYPLPMEYEEGAIQPTYTLPGSNTLASQAQVNTGLLYESLDMPSIEESITWHNRPRPIPGRTRPDNVHQKRGNQGDPARKRSVNQPKPNIDLNDPEIKAPPSPEPPKWGPTPKEKIAFTTYLFLNLLAKSTKHVDDIYKFLEELNKP